MTTLSTVRGAGMTEGFKKWASASSSPTHRAASNSGDFLHGEFGWAGYHNTHFRRAPNRLYVDVAPGSSCGDAAAVARAVAVYGSLPSSPIRCCRCHRRRSPSWPAPPHSRRRLTRSFPRIGSIAALDAFPERAGTRRRTSARADVVGGRTVYCLRVAHDGEVTGR